MTPRAAGMALACLLTTADAEAWDARTHQAVTTEAVDALPGPLKGFYKAHRLEIPSLSPNARATEDGPERRFAIDRLVAFPFRDLPRGEADLASRFGKDEAAAIGRLPWLVLESYDPLVEAFQSGDKVRILTASDTLSLALADLHNPLALTANGDGQMTEQHGLWVRFSERLPSRGSRLKLDGDAAYLVESRTAYVFSILRSTYVWLDNVLYADDLAHQQDPSYGGVYYEALDEKAGNILRDRLDWAARNVACYWYTAWVEAGKPDLR